MTPHIEAKKEDIAKIVIMPGDPLRAKFIAETYLQDVKQINSIRNILGYTGYYEDKQVTVMGSGMGMPSIGIYSYELFKFYDVDVIIRIGSCGAYTERLNLYDLILVDSCYSESTFAKVQNGYEENVITSDKAVTNIIAKTAEKENKQFVRGCVYSSDVFYSNIVNIDELYHKKNCLGIEMESFALFHNAKILNKKAACLLTVSNNLITNEETTSIERQKSFTEMIELALKSILSL